MYVCVCTVRMYVCTCTYVRVCMYVYKQENPVELNVITLEVETEYAVYDDPPTIATTHQS